MKDKICNFNEPKPVSMLEKMMGENWTQNARQTSQALNGDSATQAIEPSRASQPIMGS